ncbi:ABC transporter permease subunit [Bacillus sp. EAC]|uniref:ABC transporter permease subunit n=1 Tax=Bacillus sp. EAC TaxID=1978338 RepID=UPI001C4FC760|nr:ABC transporter permease subunit [Bacillus sp. EAC]
MKMISITFEKLFQLLLTIVMIGLIVAFSVSLQVPRSELFHTFWDQIQLYLGSLFYINTITIQDNQAQFDLLTNLIQEPYVYSLIILAASFLTSLMVALILSFGLFLLPIRIRKIVQECLYFLQSIPDVMFIFATQLIFIWIYHKTGVIILDPIAGFDKVYILPILVVSILPGMMLSQMTLLAIEEERQKTYVEYAITKGLTMKWILFKQIFRNVLVTVFSNIQYLFWFLISNLLVLEYLFNMNGYFKLLYQLKDTPEAFFVCLVFLFIPFYLFDVVSKLLIFKLTGEEQLI